MTKQDLTQAIKDAMQTEKDAMDYYRLGAEKMHDEKARATFTLLAKEEEQHAKSFYDVYPGDDIPSFEEFINGPVNDQSSWFGALQKALLGDFEERQALELAIEQEEALEKQLRAIAATIDDPQVKAIYLANANSTHKHLELVEGDYRDIYGM